MDIQTLCHKIHLQPEISRKVLAVERSFDFNTVSGQLGDFLIYQRMGTAQKELKTLLGEDKDNLKILTCMLKASADAYEIYQMKGISDEIYFATMKCYPVAACQGCIDMIDCANCITSASSSFNSSNDNEGTHSAISSNPTIN